MYGDSHEERVRELIETGSSIRYTGRPIMTMVVEALESLDRDDGGNPEPA